MTGHKKSDDGTYWLDKPGNVARLVRCLYFVCSLLLAIDVFVPKHGPFKIEHVFGFYGVFGFFGTLIMAWLFNLVAGITGGIEVDAS